MGFLRRAYQSAICLTYFVVKAKKKNVDSKKINVRNGQPLGEYQRRWSNLYMELRMFFTKLGRIVAWIATVTAALSIFIGYEIQWNQADSFVASLLSIESPEEARAQYRTSISQGYVVLFCGLVLGILAEISLSVAHKPEV